MSKRHIFKSIMIDGMIYKDYKSAAKEKNIIRNTIRDRCLSVKYPTWLFCTDDGILTTKSIKDIDTGKRFTKEARAKMSLARKGKKLSEETKRKIGESNRGKLTLEETKIKLSESRRGVCHTDTSKANILETKYIRKLTIPVKINGRLFKSLANAGKHFKISHSLVSYRCRSKNYYGWTFVDRDKIEIKKG